MEDAEPGASKKASRIRCASRITWCHPKDPSHYAFLELPVGTQITVDSEVMEYQERRAALALFWTYPLRKADIAKALRQMGWIAKDIVLAMQRPNRYDVSAYTLANVVSVTAWEANRWPRWLQQLHGDLADALIKEGSEYESWLQAIRARRWEKICRYENFDRLRLKGSMDPSLAEKRPASSKEPSECRSRDLSESENESTWEQLEKQAREKGGRGAWRRSRIEKGASAEEDSTGGSEWEDRLMEVDHMCSEEWCWQSKWLNYNETERAAKRLKVFQIFDPMAAVFDAETGQPKEAMKLMLSGNCEMRVLEADAVWRERNTVMEMFEQWPLRPREWADIFAQTWAQTQEFRMRMTDIDRFKVDRVSMLNMAVLTKREATTLPSWVQEMRVLVATRARQSGFTKKGCAEQARLSSGEAKKRTYF